MPRKPRILYTETDKALMWDRWREVNLGQGLPLPNAWLSAQFI